MEIDLRFKTRPTLLMVAITTALEGRGIQAKWELLGTLDMDDRGYVAQVRLIEKPVIFVNNERRVVSVVTEPVEA